MQDSMSFLELTGVIAMLNGRPGRVFETDVISVDARSHILKKNAKPLPVTGACTAVF